MKRNRCSTPYAASLLLVALLAGCSKKEEPAATPAPNPVQAATPAVQPAAAVQKPLSSAAGRGASTLDFRRRTDPFKPYAPAVAAPPAGAGAPQARVRSTEDLLPIQTFEVGKFKVAGIIAGLTENRALLIDPAGKGYVVQQGMLIGNNDGRITRITASSVEVVENFREDTGRIRKRKIVLTLAKKR
ncbi:MAG: pilus assembly protein PilP [Geobacteraceae bacterium GWC2_58_44]|nr:MAG: pilus assembly protein PilP [Geobacteraceae bacterium GWC2_58_44]HBG08260.1 pilus assembly protein PilP [Geobacter sp.]